MVLIGLATSGVERAAAAHGMPECSDASAIGGSVAYASFPRLGQGVIYGMDAALLRYCLIWAGGGLRVFENLHAEDRTLLPYVEAGAWVGLNVGAGYTIDASRGNFRPGHGAGFQLFFGEPIPLFGNWYVEPYYRVTYLRSDALNELGVLFKWGWELERPGHLW